MPATQDYTLIQLMRGGKYAVESVVPEVAEPLLDLDSGTLYFGNGKDSRGIPFNTVTSVKVESPANLDALTTWGRYYLEGKTINLPEGVELYGKFFLTVEGSTATDAESLFQTLHVLTGDYQDKVYVRSSTDSGESWSLWKTSGGGSGSSEFSGGGEGTIDKNPLAGLDEYVLSSNNYIESISDGPEGTDGCSGFLIVYRKDLDSPYVYQQLIVLDSEGDSGKVFYRLSVNGNLDWSAPGYNWREISDPKKYIIYMSTDPVSVPSDLKDGGFIVVS